MSLLHIEPSEWIGGATHLIRIFFATEQDITIGGRIEVLLPVGFIVPSPCEATDLDRRVYAVSSAVPTALRVIGVEAGCRIVTEGAHNGAAVTVSGRLVAGQRYAFGLVVRNPPVYNSTHQDSWFLYSRDYSGRRMDGSYGSVPLNEGEPATARSWGMYQERLPRDSFNVTVTDLRPFALSDQYARVVVGSIKLPITFTGAVRVTAPQGFLWRNVDASGFAMNPSDGSNYSAAWPGGVPSVAYGNQLLFQTATYSGAHTYGFEVDVEVPDRNPGYSEWRIEAGWDATTPEARPCIGIVTGLPVKALSEGFVRHTYNAVGQQNAVMFRIRTETHLYGPGGIVIEMPLGFSSVPYCMPLGINNGPSTFPSDIHCAYMSAISPYPAISIIGSRTGGIPAGLYEWRLVLNNPDEVSELVTDDATDCGWNHCFTFYALGDVLDFATAIDYKLTVKGVPTE